MTNLPEPYACRNGMIFLDQDTEAYLDAIEYQHSLLCSLTLPRSNQLGREYVREYQGRSPILKRAVFSMAINGYSNHYLMAQSSSCFHAYLQ
jgi:hypothetical protein